jgi:hypothetical protein
MAYGVDTVKPDEHAVHVAEPAEAPAEIEKVA